MRQTSLVTSLALGLGAATTAFAQPVSETPEQAPKTSPTIVVSAGRDLTLSAAKVSAGGDASLSAGRDVSITGVTTTDTTSASSRTSKKNSSSSSTTTQTFNGTTLTSGANLSVAAGNALTIKGADIAAGGNATLTGTNGVSITSALENSSADSASKTKRTSSTVAETASTNRLSTITAGGNLGAGSSVSGGRSGENASAGGNVTIAGADLSATGTTTLVGQSVTVTGVIDSATFDATSRTVKKGLLSKKVTTTTGSSTSQAVVASTISGDRVNVIATGGDVTVRGSNIVSDNPVLSGVEGGTVVQATNNVTIGTLEARSSQSQSVKVKKSGLSLSGAGLFAGVAKSTQASTLETTTNTGSLVGSANGDVTVNAGKALSITGSQVAAPGIVNLVGESVRIENATDTANSTSLSKSSSFGVSLKAYENVSGAVKSVSTLADRVGSGAKGGAAATGITAASETLRTVAALTNALTNTAGVTASIGFSKSKSTTATQESAVVGSTITGGTVNVTATSSDVRVIGSSITSSGDTNLNAARDVILESAQNQIDSQFISKSSGASLGVTVGVAVVGGVTASASVGVNASKSSGTSTETTQTNSSVTTGGTLSLTTGRDAILKGAVAQGQNVIATIGRDLSVESVQDNSSRSSTSKGFSAGLTLAPGAGLGGNGSVNVGKGSGSSSIVSEQTALLAREGSLNATVKSNTDIKGGVIASVDADGKDTGRLALSTGTLTASDIKDSAKSKDVSVGISASINNVTDKAKRSANLPVVDGSFASSSFKQDTKATVGQGTLSVGVPDANITINRDVDTAQVVTKDKSTGFTVYADVAAAKELVSLVKGVAGDKDAKANSVIIQGVEAVKSLSDNKVDSSPFDKAVSDAFRLIAGRKAAAQADALSVAADKRFVNPDGTIKPAAEITDIRIGDAIASTRAQFGDAAAAEVAAELRDPTLRASLDKASGLIIAYKQGGYSDPAALAEATTNGKPRVAGSGFIATDGSESVVTAGSRTFGDDVIVVLDAVGGKISQLEKGNPRTASALSFTLGLLISGPVGAVGDVVVGKAVEAELARNKAARDGLVTVVNEVGLRATTALSSTSLEKDRESAEFGKFETENNVLKAGATVLGISTIAKLLKRTGGGLDGGINPNAGDVPDVRDVIGTAFNSPSPLAGAKGIVKESAEAVNATFPRHTVFDPPFTPGTTTRTFTTTQDTTLVRVTADANRQTGGFFVQASEIAGKTPEQIRVYLGLPDTPTYIQTVRIPAGTVLREGQVGPQLKFQPRDTRTVSPGAIQFQAVGKILDPNFGSLTPIRPGKPVK